MRFIGPLQLNALCSQRRMPYEDMTLEVYWKGYGTLLFLQLCVHLLKLGSPFQKYVPEEQYTV